MRYRLGVSWLISNMIRSPRPGVCRHGQRRCSLPHLVGPATHLWSGFGGVTTESKKVTHHTQFLWFIVGYTGIYIYIYVCIYIYTYGSYIIPILIYIYIYKTPPYLGWFMMVSYRVFFWDGSWTVDPRRTFAPSWSLSSCEGPTWGRRGNHVRFVELNQSLFWSTWNSPMKIVLVILVLLFIHGGLICGYRHRVDECSLHMGPQLSKWRTMVVPLDMAHFRSANRRCEMCVLQVSRSLANRISVGRTNCFRWQAQESGDVQRTPPCDSQILGDTPYAVKVGNLRFLA